MCRCGGRKGPAGKSVQRVGPGSAEKGLAWLRSEPHLEAMGQPVKTSGQKSSEVSAAVQYGSSGQVEQWGAAGAGTSVHGEMKRVWTKCLQLLDCTGSIG